MAPVQWSTLICDRDGVADYKRIRALASICLAVSGAIPLILSMLGISIGAGDTGHMALGVGVLVTPLTAGRVTDAIAARRQPTVAESIAGDV